jgi:PAS domain S-box-containing protein
MKAEKISILYVEDEEDIRLVYTPLLKKRTTKLYIAENGYIGLELFKKHKPDLVISDIRMPIMNGLEMTEEIKKLNQDVRILIMSAYSQPEYFIKAITLGVNGFLTKPIRKEQLFASIDEQFEIIETKQKIKIEEKKRFDVEFKLHKLNEELEMRVEKRTRAIRKQVTERKIAVEMLQESEEKYRQIFENANDGILLTIDGVVKFINPKLYEITGFLPKETISKPFTDFVHPSYREAVSNNHLGRLKGEKVDERYDIQAYNKSGDLRWFELKSALIKWESKPAVLTFVTDITERKETAAELHELNLRLENRVQEELKKIEAQQQLLIQKSKLESLGELAAGIAHEINQPLGGISLTLDNILYKLNEDKLTNDYLKEKLKQSFEDIDRIKMIINHIRLFSRDQDKEEYSKVDVHEVIDNALNMVKNQYQNLNIDFQLSLKADPSNILGNPYKLEQVLLNLFSNAKFAMDEKTSRKAKDKIAFVKKIKIDTYISGNEIQISVEDNGLGIPQNLIKNVFDLFFTTKPIDSGTGLGLSISYGIIKEMKGDIKINSLENEYTKMILILPLYKD